MRKRQVIPEARKREAIALIHKGGQRAATVARTLGVDRSTVHRWLRQADKAGTPAVTSPLAPSDDTTAMRARIRELEEENTVLRRALAYMSRGAR